MGFDPEKHHRGSIRLSGYDYSQAGAYFVTILTHGRVCRFGQIHDGNMNLNDLGRLTLQEWTRLESRFPLLTLDEFVVMPNHLHGILLINCKGAAGFAHEPATDIEQLRPLFVQESPSRPIALGVIVGAFKSTVSRLYRVRRTSRDEILWQRNYYEHIIRDEEEWEKIRLYIQANPSNWETKDEYFTER